MKITFAGYARAWANASRYNVYIFIRPGLFIFTWFGVAARDRGISAEDTTTHSTRRKRLRALDDETHGVRFHFEIKLSRRCRHYDFPAEYTKINCYAIISTI